MKNLLLLSLLFLSPAVFAQEAIEPVKISVIALSADELDAQLVKEIKSQLQTRRYGVVENRADWIMAVTAAPLEGVACVGYSATLMAGSGNDRKRDRVSMHTAADLQTLAKHLIEKMEREFFKPLNGAATEERRMPPKD